MCFVSGSEIVRFPRWPPQKLWAQYLLNSMLDCIQIWFESSANMINFCEKLIYKKVTT